MNHCHTNQEAYLEAFRVECMLKSSHMQRSHFQIHVEPIVQSESSGDLPIIDTCPEEGELLDINSLLFMDYQQGVKEGTKGKSTRSSACTRKSEIIAKDIKDAKSKDGTPMQDQSNDDLTINLEDVSGITPTEDHPSEGVEDKGTELISADDIDKGSVNHKPQMVELEQ